MANSVINHRSLRIERDIQYEEVMGNVGIVLYNETEKGKLLEIIGVEVALTNEVQIAKNQSYFWIMRACGRQSKEDIEQIQRLIGLTFTIICIEISNFLEAIIQKAFSNVLNHTHTSHNEIKLIFIKSSYKNKLHTIEIKYCKDTPQALPLIYQNNYLKTNPIKVFDLIQIFDCDLPQNVAKVRKVYQKFETLKRKEDEFLKVNEMIFSGERQKGNIQREIQNLHLPSRRENKLIWKLERLNHYKEWLEEQKYFSGIECSKYTFKDIDSKINYTSIKRYQRIWTTNSLLALKGKFKKIIDKKDVTSIKNFTCQYEAMKSNLQNIEKQVQNLPYAHAFTIMKHQLEQFYLYHEEIMKEQAFGLFKYLKEEAKFLWRHNNRIYKKMAAFGILLAFAYAQGDLIKSLSVLSIALIVLALRC